MSGKEPFLKELVWVGASKDAIRGFPEQPKQRLGYQLDLVQRGKTPSNWKSVPGLGKNITGVKELRVSTSDGWFRVVYVTNIGDKIYVLHAFQKKTNRIEPADIKIIKTNYKSIADGK